MRRVAILQSNYIPWKGYFDIIASCDVFVFYDDVQYTKNDWRNRNIIKTASGPKWLTIPVAHGGRFGHSIDAMQIADRRFAKKHWQALITNYAKAAHFEPLRDDVAELYREIGELPSLSQVNRRAIEWVCARLGIATTIVSSRDFELPQDRNARLVALCQALGAGAYLSGPSAKAYIDVSLFEAAGIALEWMTYNGYPEYPQLHGPFLETVTVLDLLFNVGPAAAHRFMRPRVGPSTSSP